MKYAIYVFACCMIMSYYPSKAANVQITSNPLKTIVFKGTHDRATCFFRCEIPTEYMDISDGVWQVKVGNVYIEDKLATKFDQVMLIFEIKTDLVFRHTTLSQLPIPYKYKEDNVNDRFSSCRKPLGEVLRSTDFVPVDFLPTSVRIEQTLWSHAVTLEKRTPFYYVNPAQVGNEWFTIEHAEKNSFVVFFEQKHETAFPPTTNFQFNFEIVFLFKRML